MGELGGVGHEVDLRDPALFDCEGDDGDRPLAWEYDDAGVAVDDRRPGVAGEAGAAREDAAGDVLGSFDRPAVAGQLLAEVGVGAGVAEPRLGLRPQR